MSLEMGSMLAHYKLAEKIGEGGMGEVFRARDTKLNRDVALKILPEAFASDSQRMARFGREAQVLASLNHPHVGAIYGLEEHGGTKALVLELIKGETLAERVERGPLPVSEALVVASQIAAAMESAHEKGIIHRDLKPANVKITPGGSVKVLDFGLAKALADDATWSPELTRSPTLTVPPTQAGLILGTAGYMAPEQARGRPIDRRADVWAFGVILFEMLTGTRLFAGETVTDILAAVVRAEPDWSKLPDDAPVALKRLLRRCMAKDPAGRLRDFGDVRLELTEAAEAPAITEAPVEAPARAPLPMWRRLLPWVATILVGATAAALGFLASDQMRDEVVLHASILPPAETVFHLDTASPGIPAVSPDGRMVAFTARDADVTSDLTSATGAALLYVRPLGASDAYVLTGTQGAQYPFWSPDSRYIGFFTRRDGTLKKIAASGGPPLTLCEAENGKGGTWNEEGLIVFSPSYDTPLSTVRESGGIPAPLTALKTENGDSSHRHPYFLPDGRHILYYARGRKMPTGASGAVFARPVDAGPEEGDGKLVMQSEAGAIYASGHLIFIRDRVLMAQPFDGDRLELSGEPFPLAEKVTYISGASKGIFSASENGVLAFIAGMEEQSSSLSWVDPQGAPQGTLGDEALYRELHLSPDGTRAAVAILDQLAGSSDLWIYEIERDLRTRFTFGPEEESFPVWSPDGETLYYAREVDGRDQIFAKVVGGASDERLAFETEHDKYPSSLSPDARYLAYSTSLPETGWDVWVLPLSGDEEPFPFASTRFVEVDGRFSPDGRWMAYLSAESGQGEIYVAPFPGPGRKWQISTKGGDQPLWSDDGRKLYYQDPSGAVNVVAIEIDGDTFKSGPPEVLFERPRSEIQYRYAPAPGGERFLVVDEAESDDGSPLSLVLNWTASADQ